MCVYANVNLLMIVYKSNGKFESVISFTTWILI